MSTSLVLHDLLQGVDFMTKMKNAERLNNIAPSGIRQLFSRAQGIPGVISLGIGQPNIPTPKGLIDLVTQLIKGGDNYYSPTPGTKKYREGVVEQNKRDYNLDYNNVTFISQADEINNISGGIPAKFWNT